jgi:hypothetical protein
MLKQELLDMDGAYRKLHLSFNSVQNIVQRKKGLFNNFHLVIILVTLIISVFNVSIISFGYFVFCMILISKTKQVYFDATNLIKFYKYYIIPYMIFDIGLTIIF